MQKLRQIFFKGLITILPLALTIAILYWLGSMAENSLGHLLKLVLPEGWYFVGMGLMTGFAVVFVIGILVNAYLFRALVQLIEKIFKKIPLVKTIFNSVKDISKFASPSDGKEELQKAVMVTLKDEMQVIGFITRKELRVNDESHVAVYVPMSYQIGGFTLLVKESKIQVMDMGVQDAMRLVLTAGIAGEDTGPTD